MGLDIDQLKVDMISNQVLTSIKALGDGRYPIGDKHYALVLDDVVVTIVNRYRGITAITKQEGKV